MAARDVLSFFERNEVKAPREISRHSLKGIVDQICGEFRLTKWQHTQVTACVIELFEQGKLVAEGGTIKPVDDRIRAKQGRRRTGRDKVHCRGARIQHARRLKASVA